MDGIWGCFSHPLGLTVVTSMEDVLIETINILVIIAQKLKKKVDEIPLSKSIKDLVGRKSTLQNEILSDLQQEFTSAPEKVEELPLEKLGLVLGRSFSGALGKYNTNLISCLIRPKMPGGFNSSTIKCYLSKNWGLGVSCSDGVLLLGTMLEPPKQLASKAEGENWVDGIVSVYAQHLGISLLSLCQDALHMYHDIIFDQLTTVFLIKKSRCAALPSLTRLTLTCFNSCRITSINAMLQRERLTD